MFKKKILLLKLNKNNLKKPFGSAGKVIVSKLRTDTWFSQDSRHMMTLDDAMLWIKPANIKELKLAHSNPDVHFVLSNCVNTIKKIKLN